MNVGCAGCIITPDRPLLLEGYGGRDRPAEGTLDPLEARAIVFDDGHTEAAILMVDVCGLTRASTRRIRSLVEAACAIRPEHVMVTYSHTHSAPATTPYVNQPPDPSYLAWLE
jgi:neutral ceramidase